MVFVACERRSERTKGMMGICWRWVYLSAGPGDAGENGRSALARYSIAADIEESKRAEWWMRGCDKNGHRYKYTGYGEQEEVTAGRTSRNEPGVLRLLAWSSGTGHTWGDVLALLLLCHLRCVLGRLHRGILQVRVRIQIRVKITRRRWSAEPAG